MSQCYCGATDRVPAKASVSHRELSMCLFGLTYPDTPPTQALQLAHDHAIRVEEEFKRVAYAEADGGSAASGRSNEVAKR